MPTYFGRSAQDLALRQQTGEPEIGQDGTPMDAQPIMADGTAASRIVAIVFWGRSAEDLALRFQTGEPEETQGGDPEEAQPLIFDGKTASEAG